MLRRNIQRIGLLVTLVTVLLLGQTTAAIAQGKASTNSQAVVDVVNLKSGRALRGATAWHDPATGLTMAVSREWLRAANPNLYDSILRENLDQRMDAWISTRERIEDWQKKIGETPQLSFFLKQEKERLSKLIAKPDPELPGFLWVDLPDEKVARISTAGPERLKIALFAWNEALRDVETRGVAVLTKELNAKGVKLDGLLPDLFDWLSSRPQSSAEWAARQALVEYTLVKPLDFQGTGGMLVRTGDGQAVKLAEILPQVMQSQLGSLLKDLNLDGAPKQQESRRWWQSAIQQAERAQSRGFRATQVTVDPTTFRATVESRFLAQLAAGNWNTIWLHKATEDGTKARPDLEARIEQDPQFKSLTDATKSLGLSSSPALQQAIRFGAATMAAQEAVDAAFGEFRERYVRKLDGPPLRLPQVD